jgi:glycosyltransferase involved in cell wall biosynthesis
MRRKVDLSLVLACRNLEPKLDGNLRQIIRTLALSKFTYELILIDDASDDSTAAIIKKFAQSIRTKFPRIKTVYHHARFGRSRTLAEGLKLAKAPVIGMLSPGLGISPAYIPVTADTIISGDADVLVGRRIFHPGANAFVRLGNYFLLKSTGLMVDTAGADVYSSFKFFNRKKLGRIISRVKNTGRLWDTELLILAKRAGFRIAELPVVYRPKATSFPPLSLWEESTGFVSDLVGLWRRLYVKSRGHI